MLTLQNVSFHYGENGPEILQNIQLNFGRGEFVAVTGRNGSGKTTITRLLTGLEKPTSGRVCYNGQDVTREDAAARSRFIGYVFQQPDRQMFMSTVREEVGFGPYQQGKRGQSWMRWSMKRCIRLMYSVLPMNIRVHCPGAISSA